MTFLVDGTQAADRQFHDGLSLRLLQVVAGLDVNYGGPSYSVPRLCQALAARGMDVSLFSVANAHDLPSIVSVDGYRDMRFKWDFARVPVLSGLRQSGDLAKGLWRSTGGAGVVHNHGLWLSPNLTAGRVARKSKLRLVVSPRGMLSAAALSFSSLKKRAVWLLAQRQMLSAASCLHATSDAEYLEFRAIGLRTPVAIVPNGIDLPMLDSSEGELRKKTVLSIGRIHPKKGLDKLLRAWAHISRTYPDWQLHIAGPDEGGYANELRRLSQSLNLSRVAIEGAVYGPSKLALYRSASLFVLPTLNENFGITIAELLAAGIPVITTKGAPWAGLQSENCGWWIEPDAGAISAALNDAMSLQPQQLRLMGARGRAWMERDFSWDGIAQKMIDVYRWICGQGAIPATVRLD